MRRIAIPALAALSAVTAWSHGFMPHSTSQPDQLGSVHAAGHIAPVPLHHVPSVVLILPEEN